MVSVERIADVGGGMRAMMAGKNTHRALSRHLRSGDLGPSRHHQAGGQAGGSSGDRGGHQRLQGAALHACKSARRCWSARPQPLAKDRATIEVRAFDMLLVKFAESVGAAMIIRGLRAVSDFEYEFQMVAMNQRLNTEIETVFLMADPRHQAIASRLVKEIALLGGDLHQYLGVPQDSPVVEQARQKILAACKAHNVACGITATTKAEVDKRLGEGWKMIRTARGE